MGDWNWSNFGSLDKIGTGAAQAFGVNSGDPTNPYRDALTQQAQQQAQWGQGLQGQYQQNQLGINNTIGMLQANALGANSVSMEQARQNLMQAQAQQMSMAAGAAPQNQAMAARTAMINAGQQGSGIMGQQAMAGVQERNAAINSLGGLQMQQAGMNMQGALGAAQNVNGAYGTTLQYPQKTGGAIIGGLIGGMAGGAARG